jgi:integrase
MGKKRSVSGLRLRNGIWHIEKMVDGKRLFESTHVSQREEAEKVLIFRLEQIRHATVFGTRPVRTFKEAATRYLMENQHKRSLSDEARQIQHLCPHIGDMRLDKINMFTLQPYIAWRQQQGVTNWTINHALQIIRQILNLAHQDWFDEFGLTWLASAPKIKLLPLVQNRSPYPLTWEEQDQLFALLPDYLRRMALFKVNTGLRDQEVCQLCWAWEYPIPELNTRVFVIPSAYSKNKCDRLVILNDIARQVLQEVRGQHPIYVFTGRDGQDRVSEMNNRAWQIARKQLNIPVRIHDLKHTFGRRLRAAHVSHEDRQDLLGHKSHRITTHYSSAEVKHLIDAANKVCCREISTPTLTVIRVQALNALIIADHIRIKASEGSEIPGQPELTSTLNPVVSA